MYDGMEYPGVVRRKTETGVVVSCLEKKSKFWKWPKNNNEMEYDAYVRKIRTPVPRKRGF